ncbi:MAG: hypothetical protein CR989_00575 [Flavobacteriales bacterium]|nr:MAG: hypothetical protein CR989_00575 [Flavobacteriales bacterium]
MKGKIIMLFLISSLIWIAACERDDICIEPTTPQLIIRFYNNKAPEDFKSVNSLLVRVIGRENDSLTFAGKDSIVVPIRVNALETKYLLTVDYSDTAKKITDTLSLSYQTEDVFVGRSCGYKSIFKNVNYKATNHWINGLEVVATIIENENNAHVKMYH